MFPQVTYGVADAESRFKNGLLVKVISLVANGSKHNTIQQLLTSEFSDSRSLFSLSVLNFGKRFSSNAFVAYLWGKQSNPTYVLLI